MARERIFTEVELFQVTKEILLNNGYEGFTFSLLANHLESSRATLYKYFKNKEELISFYLLHEMDRFLIDIHRFEDYDKFEEQFDYLLYVIFKNSKIHQMLSMSYLIPVATSKTVLENKMKLEALHKDMYLYLQSFIALGRKEKRFKPTIPDGLILGFIFQTVDIPNHYSVPHDEWMASIKEIISHGMFT